MNYIAAFRQHGYPVRRQHPIGDMIVDFAIERMKLVIEIDGSIHNRLDVQEKDHLRDTKLKALGWRIVRISNHASFHDDWLSQHIAEELGI